jgi:hypothetical protein
LRDPADDDFNIRGVREFWQAMQPFASGGIYVNYEAETGVENVKRAFGLRKLRAAGGFEGQIQSDESLSPQSNIAPAGAGRM